MPGFSLYLATAIIHGGFIMPLTPSNFAFKAVLWVLCVSIPMDTKTAYNPFFGACGHMGRNAYNLPFFVIFYFGRNWQLFFAQFWVGFWGSFCYVPSRSGGFSPKSRKSRESPESRKPSESLEGLKVVKVVSRAVTKQQQRAIKQEQ